MTAASTSAATPGGKVAPVTVLYCAICSFPPEYCEYSSRSPKCKQWLEDTHPDLYAKYYSDSAPIQSSIDLCGSQSDPPDLTAALEDKLATLTVEQRENLEKDVAKKGRKEEAKEQKEKERIAASKVTIKRIERNKRKFITGVHGLESFDIDLKKAAKFFANKFATGSSVSKNPQGEEEIFIQGDVADEVEDLILDDEDKKAQAVFGGKVKGEQIEVVDEGKLKKKNAGA